MPMPKPMRIPRIYCPNLTLNQTITLDTKTSHYCCRVLRLKPQATLRLFDGGGHEYHAIIEVANPKQAQVTITKAITTENESPLNIRLAQVISRNQRMDYVIQKSVELGVTEIVPLSSHYCNLHLSTQRQQSKLAHWQQVMISACEQSGRNYMPQIQPITALTDYLKPSNSNSNNLRLFFQPDASYSLKTLPVNTNQAIEVLIGAEGGFNDNEIQQIQQSGFTAIKLGPRVLRTETATVTVLSCLQLLWGDLG